MQRHGSALAETDPERAEPEILPPGEREGNNNLPPGIYAEIIAQISQYTERPDLLLETLEKHSPGYIRESIAEGRELNREERRARFKFTRFQSYLAVTVRAVAVIALITIAGIAVYQDHASFPTLAGLGLMIAIAQSGPAAALRAMERILLAWRGKDPDTRD